MGVVSRLQRYCVWVKTSRADWNAAEKMHGFLHVEMNWNFVTVLQRTRACESWSILSLHKIDLKKFSYFLLLYACVVIELKETKIHGVRSALWKVIISGLSLFNSRQNFIKENSWKFSMVKIIHYLPPAFFYKACDKHDVESSSFSVSFKRISSLCLFLLSLRKWVVLTARNFIYESRNIFNVRRKKRDWEILKHKNKSINCGLRIGRLAFAIYDHGKIYIQPLNFRIMKRSQKAG